MNEPTENKEETFCSYVGCLFFTISRSRDYVRHVFDSLYV